MVSLEEENFLRIVYLYYRVVTPSLKRFFDGKHSNLSADLSANKTKLFQLYNPPPGQTRVLYKQQIDTLYPPTGSPPVASADFDLTLMVCLLRNLPPVVTTPRTGFDKLPPRRDTTYGANIARIKYYKNYLVSHSTSGKIVVNVFNDIWKELEMAIKGLGSAQDEADAKIAKTKILDSSMTTLLSTQHLLEIKIAKLEKRMEREEITKTEITTRIKTFEEQTLTAEKSTKQLIEENKNKTSETLKEMQDKSHGECTRIDTNVKVIEKEIAELKKLHVGLSADDTIKQIESKCSEIQRQLSVHDERISALEEVKLQEDVKYSETKLDIEELRTEVAQIKTDQKSVPDWMIEKLEKWKKEDEYFVKTRASEFIKDCLQKHVCVSVVGPSGVGKSFLVQHVALEMESEGYVIIKVNSPEEIKENFMSNRPTLFVVDDFCGNFTANANRLDAWKRSSNDLTTIIESNAVKLIVTCRLQVFQDEGFKHSDFHLFKTCICNLVEESIALTDSEKESMLLKYVGIADTNELECLYQYDFFPLLCKLLNTKMNQSNFCMKTFLEDPFSSFEDELNDLFLDCKEGKYKIVALLLLVISNNHLDQTLLSGNDVKAKNILEDILEDCCINERVRLKSLIKELDTLTGTFVSNEKGVYRTIHDKLFDFLAYYFGTKNEVTQTDFVELLIRHADKKVIEERFVIKEPDQSHDSKNKEYVITIQGDNLQLYTKRVFDDMKKYNDWMEFLSLNRNRYNKTFQDSLCTIIENLQDDEISNLIKTASRKFVSDMFVMDVNDIKINFPYGIILDHDHLQEYIERVFFDMTTSDDVEVYMLIYKCCSNDSFCTALLTYVSKLSSTEITNLIQIASISFVQLMFVMKKDDIHFDSISVFERYGIEINSGLKHLYSQRVFKEMIQSTDVPNYMSSWRCCRNKDFNTAIQSLMVNLSSDIVIEIINNASTSFIQNMFVFEEHDIKFKCRHEHVYTSYGIVLSADVVQVYIHRVFDDIAMSNDVNEHLNGNRNKGNTLFQGKLLQYMTHLDGPKIQHFIEHGSQNFIYKLCVVSMDEIHTNSYSEWERFGVIIPDEYIQLYVCRWFDEMTKSHMVHRFFEGNRNRQTKKFKTALQTYMAEIAEERIEKIIQTETGDVLHNLFVTTTKDIKNDSNRDIEQYGIVLPEKYLKMYTKKILDLDYFKENIACNRTINAVLKCISQYDISRITELVHASNEKVFHQMITVDIENEFSYPDYLSPDPIVKNMFEIEIICPVILINLFMDRMILDWSNGESHAVFKNKNLKNQSFVDRFLKYLNLLEPSKISELLHKGDRWNNTPLVISCEQGEVNLAKWCLEKHLHENPEQEHTRLFALFLLVVFNNELEETFLNDELIKITDSKYSFRNMHQIRKDISVKAVKKELNTSLQIIGVGKREGIYSVRNSKVFKFLVFFFASIRHMSKILVEYADEKFLSKWFLIQTSFSNKEQFNVPLPDEELFTCINRVFTKMTNSEKLIKYILKGDDKEKINSLFVFVRKLTTKEVTTVFENACIDFINKFFVIAAKETKGNSDEGLSIVIPDELIPIYIKMIFDHISTNECVEACLQDNRNKKNEMFNSRLLIYMKELSKDNVKRLINQASSDFINRVFVISEEDIKHESFWEYERYGIVVPEDLLQMYIERVFSDITKSVYVPVNRNSENNTFRDTLNFYTSSFSETKLISLIDTASSKSMSRMFISEGGDLIELDLPRYAHYMCIPKCYFRPGSKTHYTRKMNKTSLTEDDVSKVTIITNEEENFEDVMITINSKLSFDNLQQILSKYIDPMFTNNMMVIHVRIPTCLIEKYIQRMVAEFIEGNVHDVFGNINLSTQSFLNKFLTHLQNIETSMQARLTDTADNKTGDSPLAVSCRVGIFELVEWCLVNNANTNSYNKYNERPLYIACTQNCTDIVHSLLHSKDKADVNRYSGNFDISPLYEACKHGNGKIVSMLLMNNATVNNGLYAFYATPMYVACKYGHTEIVSILLKHNANQIDINEGNLDETPLHIACKKGHTNIVSLLLKHGANTIDINQADTRKGKTPLFYACKRGHTQIVSLLLKHDADEVDIYHDTYKQETPLYAACKGGYTYIVILLLTRETKVINKSRYDGASPLWVACRKGHVGVVSTLLDQCGIEKDKCMLTGMSPLFIATLLGHTQIAEILLRRQADVNLCIENTDKVTRVFERYRNDYMDQIRDTCLYTKKYKLNLECFIKYIRNLVRENASRDVKTYIDGKEDNWVAHLIFGALPLHIGSVMGHTDIVTLLAGRTAIINCLTENGSTPLFLACEFGHDDVVRLLLKNGANPNFERKDGKSPLSIAKENSHLNIIEIIKKHTVQLLTSSTAPITPCVKIMTHQSKHSVLP